MATENHFCSDIDYDRVKTEYLILRKEMENLYERRSRVEVTLLSVYSLILAYLLSSKYVDPIAFLIPGVLVIMCYYIEYTLSLPIYRGAAYCLEYYSKFGFTWENNILEYRKLTAGQPHSKVTYRLRIQEWYAIVLCFICVILCYYKSDHSCGYLIFCIFLCFLIFMLFIFRKNIGILHLHDVICNEHRNWQKVLKDKFQN